MSKLLTIIKREYISRVRTKGFIIATLLLPVSMVIFTIVPALLMNIKTGDATRLLVVDGSGKLAAPLERALTGAMDDDGEVSDVAARQAAEGRRDRSMQRARFSVSTRGFEGESPDEIKRKLNDRVAAKELDAFLIIPPDILGDGEAQYYGRNLSDFVSLRFVRDALTRTVRDTRLVESGIELEKVRAASARVKMTEQKATNNLDEADTGGGFIIAYVVGFLIYFTIIIYGQTILSAVVEEKTTRIAEVLFSSARAFPLMLGKLVGVSLVALTQFAVWAGMFLLLTLYGVGALAASGVNIADVLPRVPVSVLITLFCFSFSATSSTRRSTRSSARW
jgi:ABC-2 type transport system permease protein